jgi:hypothetical protein
LITVEADGRVAVVRMAQGKANALDSPAAREKVQEYVQKTLGS